MIGQKQKGFSLVELAMVLFIVSLLLGGLLMPLSSQLEAKKRNDAMDQLERIKDALIGYAIINGRLPCFTSEQDPASAYYGIEDSENPNKGNTCSPASQTTDGILPWKTLGLASGMDPWGVGRTSSSDPWTGYWRYRVDSKFVSSFNLGDSPTDDLAIVDPDGNPMTSTSERPVAIIYSTGANQTADGQNASYEPQALNNPTYEGGPVSGSFDDITGWIARPFLFSQMVAAGVLPR